MQHTTKLRTAAQIALAKVAATVKAEAAANRAARFDVDAYQVDLPTATAFGPAGDVFQFAKGELAGQVLCCSSSGSVYTLQARQDGAVDCSCPDRAKRPDRPACKHGVALKALVAAKKADRAAKLAAAQAEVNATFGKAA